MDATIMLLLLIPVILLLLKQSHKLVKRIMQQNQQLSVPEATGALPIIGHLPYIFQKPLHRTLMHLASRHGSVFQLRLGSRRVVVVSSASAAKECLTKHDNFLADRPRLPSGRIIAFEWSTMGTASQGSYWRQLRQIAHTQLLSPHRVQELSGVITQETRSLVRSLFRHGGAAPAQVELKSKLFDLLMNTLMALMCGKANSGA
jgi:cytochrome P450